MTRRGLFGTIIGALAAAKARVWAKPKAAAWSINSVPISVGARINAGDSLLIKFSPISSYRPVISSIHLMSGISNPHVYRASIVDDGKHMFFASQDYIVTAISIVSAVEPMARVEVRRA